MILEIAHEMLWGKELQALCKANVAKVKEIQEKLQGISLRPTAHLQCDRVERK